MQELSKVKILLEGYAKQKDGFEFASATATLIQDKGLNIVVDPGMDREGLLLGLKQQSLSPEQINFVILTHTHIDHCILSGIFTRAVVLDDEAEYHFDGKITERQDEVLGDNIEIIKTPGHDPFHCSVLVKTKDFGKVIIAGDIFWWQEKEEQKTDGESLLNHEDPYMKNKEQLLASRKKVLELADYIIPGHGKMFKVIK